ncbi:MAG: S46 family peptidase [Planctomycetota bacterium]
MRHVAFVSMLLAAAAPAQRETGKMWPIGHLPVGRLERECGFVPGPDWVRAVLLSTLRMNNGCSASFVSPRGLLLTNQHCVRSAMVRAGIDPGRGFSSSRGGEIRLEGVRLRQLVRVTDVTSRIRSGLCADLTEQEAESRLRANREAVLAEKAGSDVEIVELWGGVRYDLHEYRVFEDVRLCLAPPEQIAAFGGDADNFAFPRFCLDFAFCRAYAGGEPADTSSGYFRWREEGPKEGEVVFSAGHPIRTRRCLSPAQLEELRDVYYPRVRQAVEHRLLVFREHGTGPQAESAFRSHANAGKLLRAQHEALSDPALLDRKREIERDLASRAAALPGGAERFSSVERALSRAAELRRGLDARLCFHSAGGSPLLGRALLLLDWAESGDPDRLRRVRALGCEDPLRQALFVDHLERARRWLPAGDPFLEVMLAGEDPRRAAERLARKSRLSDSAFLEDLIASGGDGVRASRDAALVAARVLRALIDQNRREAAEVRALERDAARRLQRLVHEIHGDEASPEADGTLRLSVGRVAGYTSRGLDVPWRTVFAGLFARSDRFHGRAPFDLPDAWERARDRLDLEGALDFVSTLDATGGDSGSPVFDRDRRLVGLLFDGNLESLSNEFLYAEETQRSIAVHPHALAQALELVLDGKDLLSELRRTR